MKYAIVIQANSLIQLYTALTAASMRYDFENSQIYLRRGEVNNNKLDVDLSSFSKLKDYDLYQTELFEKTKNKKIILISASHFPYKIIYEIGFWRISKILRVEEGMGSYGNIIYKVKALWASGHRNLVLRHFVGVIIASIVEILRIQEYVFLFDRNNNCNVVFLEKFKKIISWLSTNEKLDKRYDTLVLSSKYLDSKINFHANYFFKGHPAWGGNNTEISFHKESAESILLNSSIKAVISEFSSTSLYAPFINGSISVCLCDTIFWRRLSVRQKILYKKYCWVEIF